MRDERNGPDRAFPFLTGLGVALALVPMPWVHDFRAPVFIAVAIAIAVPLGTLRTRDGRLAWLGAEYSIACLVAVVFASTATIFANVLVWYRDWLDLPSIVDTPSILAVVILVGTLSAWFAALFQRWADPQLGAIRPTRSRWSPHMWGPAGIVGGTLCLVAAIALTSIMIHYPQLPTLGPSRLGLWIAGMIFGATMLLGLVLLAIEAGPRRSRASDSSRRS